MKNDKPMFIRKNGKVIPIGGKGKNGQQKRKPVKRGDSYHAQKASYYEGRAQSYGSRAQKISNDKGKRFTRGAFLGATAGFLGKKGSKGKIAALGALVGGVIGHATSKYSGRDLNKAINGQIDSTIRAKAHFDLIKNHDSLGDGSSRRSFQRGLMGKKFKGSSV